MRNILAILCFVVLLSIIDGLPQRSSSSVNADAKEVTELLEKSYSLKSKEVKNEYEELCHVIKQCCSVKAYQKIFSTGMENLTHDLLDKLGSACLNTVVPDNVFKKCPSLLELNESSPSSGIDSYKTARVTMELIELSRKLEEYGPAIQEFQAYIPSVRMPNEIYAYSCMTNKKLLQSCIVKILKLKLYTKDKKVYKTFVKNVKGGFVAWNRFDEKRG